MVTARVFKTDFATLRDKMVEKFGEDVTARLEHLYENPQEVFDSLEGAYVDVFSDAQYITKRLESIWVMVEIMSTTLIADSVTAYITDCPRSLGKLIEDYVKTHLMCYAAGIYDATEGLWRPEAKDAA